MLPVALIDVDQLKALLNRTVTRDFIVIPCMHFRTARLKRAYSCQSGSAKPEHGDILSCEFMNGDQLGPLTEFQCGKADQG